jgi:hypothetical protein
LHTLICEPGFHFSAVQATLPDELLDSTYATTSSSSLAHLPQEALLQVLRQLPQQDRLYSCAATCRSLLTAAGQATQKVQLCRPGQSLDEAVIQQQADALVAWLTKHSSSSLQEVRLHAHTHEYSIPVTLRLPWQQLGHLTCLSLCGVAVAAAADCSSSGSSAGRASASCLCCSNCIWSGCTDQRTESTT